MSAQVELLPASTNIVALVEATPTLVLTDKRKFSEFYEAMREECDAHVPDLTTENGRKEIASLAYKVARTKTAIDDAGKKLNEEARARINAVDEARREIRAQLEALKDEVRAPLTKWEEAEKERKRLAAEQLASIHAAQRVDFDDTAESVKARIDELTAMAIDPEIHGAALALATSARGAALETLAHAHARIVREEEERAELERLRIEKAERDAKEAAEREAAEEKARRDAEARLAEERRIAAEKAEAEMIDAARRDAEENARREAEREAQEERERVQREHEEALAAERHRAEAAEAAAKAERDRIAQEAADQARRERDRAHRGKIMGEAKAAIITCGVDEVTAKAIVLAITAGNVPHVAIQF